MTRTVALSLSLLLGAAPLIAADGDDRYVWEFTGDYTFIEHDDAFHTDIGILALTAAFHFPPVQLGDRPWNEAAFLQHASFAGVIVRQRSEDSDTGDLDGYDLGAFARLTAPDFPLLFEASVLAGTIEDDGLDIENDLLEATGRIGFWVLENLLVGIQAKLTEEDFDGSVNVKRDTLLWGAFAKWVGVLPNGMGLNLEGAVEQETEDSDLGKRDNLVLTAGGDLYFTPQYSAGLLIREELGDNEPREGFTAQLRGTLWFNDNIALRAAWETFVARDDEDGADRDLLTIGLRGRL